MRSRDIQAGGVPGFYQRDALSHDVLMRIEYCYLLLPLYISHHLTLFSRFGHGYLSLPKGVSTASIFDLSYYSYYRVSGVLAVRLDCPG